MGFDDYIDLNYNDKLDDITKFLIRDAYKAGAASRQGEIDELKKRVKELELINFDSELHFDAAKEHVDNLQNRIDEVLDMLSKDYYTETIDECVDILKGKKDE